MDGWYLSVCLLSTVTAAHEIQADIDVCHSWSVGGTQNEGRLFMSVCAYGCAYGCVCVCAYRSCRAFFVYPSVMAVRLSAWGLSRRYIYTHIHLSVCLSVCRLADAIPTISLHTHTHTHPWTGRRITACAGRQTGSLLSFFRESWLHNPPPPLLSIFIFVGVGRLTDCWVKGRSISTPFSLSLSLHGSNPPVLSTIMLFGRIKGRRYSHTHTQTHTHTHIHPSITYSPTNTLVLVFFPAVCRSVFCVSLLRAPSVMPPQVSVFSLSIRVSIAPRCLSVCLFSLSAMSVRSRVCRSMCCVDGRTDGWME